MRANEDEKANYGKKKSMKEKLKGKEQNQLAQVCAESICLCYYLPAIIFIIIKNVYKIARR